MHGPQLLEADGADMRRDIQPQNLAVALKRFRADMNAGPIAVPAFNEFGNGCFRRVDPGAGGVLRNEPS